MTPSIVVRGIAWDHPRGYDAVVAASRVYSKSHPDTAIVWERRSLQAFADAPLVDLAQQFDLIVLDHPHAGDAAQTQCLFAWDTFARRDELANIATGSIDGTYASYHFGGHQWAVPVDAAAQVAAYRPDIISDVPSNWDGVVRLAESGKVLWPLKPVDALMSFFTIAANLGHPCASTVDLLLDASVGRVVLELMATVSRLVPPACLNMNPIETLQSLSSDTGDYAYCPLLYGYSNYARPRFRPHLVRFANIPAASDLGCRGSTLGGAGLGISRKCLAVEAAIDFVLFATSPGCQSGPYFVGGGQPSSIAAWEDPAVNEACSDFFRDTRNTLEQSWMRPRYAGYLSFQDHGGNLLNGFLRGALTASETLRQLDTAYRVSATAVGASHD